MMRTHLPEGARDRLPVRVALAQNVPGGSVVVHAEHIARRVLPAVIGDDRTRGIQGAGKMIQRAHEIALLDRAVEVGHAPALVQRHPRDDRGVIVIANDRVHPLVGHPRHVLLVEHVRVGHFG